MDDWMQNGSCRIWKVFTVFLRFVPRLLALSRKHLSTERSVHLMHPRDRDVHSPFAEAKFMRARSTLAASVVLFFPLTLPAQVTHGQKPKLPPPFATESAGNGPDRVKPPAGFLPTEPTGFRVNFFGTDFKLPRR